MRPTRKSTRERVIAVMALVLVISICFLVPKAAAQSDKYSKMAPVDQYLMERNAEILLARSAAPDSISSDATIRVLGRQGYETAVRGKNGFVCMVERSWMAAFDSPEFWNPKVRGAECLNRQAARSIVPIADLRTKLESGKVTYQGRVAKDASVFRAPGGQLFIRVNDWTYLVRPNEATVETAFQGLLVTRSGEYVWRTKESEAYNQTNYRVPRPLSEWERPEDRRVIVKPNAVTFRSTDYNRNKAMIEVSWRD